MNWSALWLSLQITFFAGVFIFIVGLILAITLARARFWGTRLERNFPVIIRSKPSSKRCIISERQPVSFSMPMA